MPIISVILPAFNASKTISEAIDSILSQSFKDWEMLVINDGSIDNTKDIIQGYTDSRIKYIENEGNKGLVYSLNRGISLSQGVYIARMDADDISLPTRLEEQLKYLQDKDLDLCGCTTTHVDMNNKVIIPVVNKSYPPRVIGRCLKYDNCIAHPTWFGKKKLFEDLNGYRDFHACEDYDFLLRAVIKGAQVGICDKNLFWYRDNSQGISGSNCYKQKLSAYYLQQNLKRINEVTPIHLENFIKECYNKEDDKKFVDSYNQFEYGINELRKKNLIGFVSIFKAVRNSKLVRIRASQLLNIILIRLFLS